MRTEVDLIWLAGRTERWIRFGAPAAERIIDRRRRTLAFTPGSVFAFVRWSANDFGTVESRLDILRAAEPGEAFATIRFVRPGAIRLLRISGWPKVGRILDLIDAVEALGLDPIAVAPDYWRHVHNRLLAGLAPRPYARERHRAWLLRERLAP
jgi:hypothetical protein